MCNRNFVIASVLVLSMNLEMSVNMIPDEIIILPTAQAAKRTDGPLK
jgi:hypothetical protein